MAEQATRPAIRTLFIQTVFSLFLAAVVFSILTYAFIVPELVGQATRIQVLESQVEALQDALAEADEGDSATEVIADTITAGVSGADPIGTLDGGTSHTLGKP